MTYNIPNTPDDEKAMLAKIGVKSIEELLAGIPKELRFNRPLNIPALSELELLSEIHELAKRDHDGQICFAGGGVYDHFNPAAVQTILSRPEFMTSYTPYQPEVAQGTLQVTYEFQTHICRLLGMDVANASMYDGATAAAEAVMLAMKVTNRNKVVVAETVNPLYRDVIKTFLSPRTETDVVALPIKDLVTDYNRVEDIVDENTACVLIAQPNFFGFLEEVDLIVAAAHKVGAKVIMAVDPVAQALLKTPGEYDADIAIGEGQPLGVPLSFGGPLVGFFAAKKELIRYMPGRIAARTVDVDGKPGFVLTLQTREQHIRRDKATSNICTNQALCATSVTVQMSLLGKSGLKRVALLSMERAQDAHKQIMAIDGFESYANAPFVREFAIKTPIPASEVIERLLQKNILCGLDASRWYPGLTDCLVLAFTEKRTQDEVARLVSGLKELAHSGVMSRL
jgi:glycine dehydrogenase subunit 1